MYLCVVENAVLVALTRNCYCLMCRVIGVVTSGTMSPVLKKGIGMGYVKPEFAKAGTDIFIKVRNKNLKAQVVKAPFRK